MLRPHFIFFKLLHDERLMLKLTLPLELSEFVLSLNVNILESFDIVYFLHSSFVILENLSCRFALTHEA